MSGRPGGSRAMTARIRRENALMKVLEDGSTHVDTQAAHSILAGQKARSLLWSLLTVLACCVAASIAAGETTAPDWSLESNLGRVMEVQEAWRGAEPEDRSDAAKRFIDTAEDFFADAPIENPTASELGRIDRDAPWSLAPEVFATRFIRRADEIARDA